MDKAKVKKTIMEILNVREKEIKNIEPAGGMTNFNYRATIQGEHFIVRIPGKGTDELVDRKTEVKNLLFATKLGINPEYIYFDTKNGIKVTREINGAHTLTPSLAKEPHMREAVIKVFHKLHQADEEMDNDFDLFPLMKYYESLVQKEKKSVWQHYETIKPSFKKIVASYQSDQSIQKVPCHIDPTYTNFIFNEEGSLFLIDWEYSGMFDPLWDIAAFSVESELTVAEEQDFLLKYFQREVTEREWSLLLIHKIFQDYFWSLWTFYKESQGSNFGDYGMMRFERAKRNITLYTEKYL